MRLWLMAWAVGCAAGWCSTVTGDEPPAVEASSEAISFRRDVAPILIQRCLGCHGPDEANGDYQVHTFEALQKEGYSGAPIVTPGDVEASELYLLVASEDEDSRMPKDADALAESEIDTIRRWIAAGAEFDGPDPHAPLASILPAAEHPAPPETYPATVPVTAVAFHPSGNELAVAGYHEITIWHPENGALLRRIGNVAQRTYGLAYHPEGAWLAVASGTPGQLGEIRLFAAESGELLRVFDSLADVALGVAFRPDGQKLAACAADRSIRIYDVTTGQQEVLIEDHADWVIDVAWSPDGQQLVSASRDKTAKVFDAATGDSLATFPGHNETVYAVSFSADGSQVLSAGGNRKVHLWNPADGAKAADLGGFGHDIYEVLVRGDQIFTCSADRQVRQHGGEKRELVRSFAGHADWVYCLDLCDATQRLATGGYDGEVRIWNVADGALVASFIAAPGRSQQAEESTQPEAN